MKMYRLSALLFCLLFFLGGCSHEYANDADSGQIPEGERKYKYHDGVFTGYESYFNNNGLSAFMQIKVKNGIISKVDFGYFDTTYTRIYEDQSESTEAQIYTTQLRQLNSAFLQGQNEDFDLWETATIDDTFLEQYHALCSMVCFCARENETSPKALNVKRIYRNTEIIDKDGCEAHLSVTYKSDRILSIDFWILNKDGQDLRENEDLIRQHFGMSKKEYTEVVARLESATDKKDLLKDAPDQKSAKLYSVYNTLCRNIQKRVVPFSVDAAKKSM